MNKKVLKLFISLFVIFAVSTSVNASVVECNPGEGNTTIEETEITYAGFDAVMPVCKWTRVNGAFDYSGSYTSYSDAWNSGYDLELAHVQTLDAKSIVNANVPKCSDGSREVAVKVSCEFVTGALYTRNTCPEKDKDACNNSGGCAWKENGDGTGVCIGNNSYPYCYNNDYILENGLCTKTKEYNFDPINEGTDPIAEARKDFGNGNCTAEYALKCPVYKCDIVYDKFSLCTPDFEIDGQPAYCVNPSQGFINQSNNYIYDSSFNVLNCASSYSTPDCGYANVLIEGAYYDTSDDAINTALRLWGVHSGQIGYGLYDGETQKPGVANVTGKNCDNITYFTTNKNGEYVNVYRATHDYIMAKFYSIAKQYEHIPTESDCYSRASLNGNTFEEISCNVNKSEMVGVMCGSGPDYRVGFELYFNTLIGNKCMKEHLGKLYNGGNGVKPTAATLQSEYSFEESSSSSSKETWIEVKFEHEAFWNEIKDETVECSESKLEELKQRLISEGKTESEAEEILNEIRPYCETKVTIIDSDGNEIVSEQDMYACIKDSGCITTKFSFAICDITQYTEKDIEIKVTYEKNRSSYSVRKYYSCGNANINQTLFAYFEDKEESENGSDPGHEISRDVDEKIFTVTNYKCSGGCENDGLRINGNSKCENNTSNYNGVYNSSVKDPSLRCIVNLDEEYAKKFDYSDYFGVNTNFCKVYCSDEVEYVLADKVKAVSGRTFMYNIEFPAMGTNELDYRLTSIVKEKRTCVSEINYHHLENIDRLKEEYGLTDEEYNELKSSKTFASLFKILKEKAKGENKREEILNQIIYDIYNCNLYSKEAIKDANVDIPKNYKSTIIQKIKSIYGKDNGYGIGTDLNGNSTGAKNSNVVKYGFGAIIKDTSNRVNNVSNDNKYTGGPLKNTNSNLPISYCSGASCYSYNSGDDASSYNYPANSASELKTYSLFTKNVKVPTNDYARFEVTAEINFYNDNKYQVDPGSGYIVLGNSNSELLTLPSYSYPIDKNAYNLSECQIKDENGNLIEKGKYHRCKVTQELKPLMFYRNNTAGNLYVNNNQFECYVDVAAPNCDPSKENCEKDLTAAVYRNVNPENLFPSGVTFNNSNWNTQKGQEVKSNVEMTAKELTVGDEYIDYSITLTPIQIKNIKNYNKQNNIYVDEVIYNCKNHDGYYYDCHSMFMDILRGSSSEFESGEYGNITIDRYR